MPRFKRALLVLAPVFWPKMPPMGIACLKAYACQGGVSVDLLDLNNFFYHLASPELKKLWLESCNVRLEEDILSIIEKFHPQEFRGKLKEMARYDAVGFSCFKSNIKTTLSIARLLKAKNKGLKIVLGGPEVARQFFKTKGKLSGDVRSLIDCLVVGEGEAAFLNYLRGSEKKQIVCFSELKSLKGLSFPDYEGLDLEGYPRKRSMSLMLGRGCVRRCRFCSERLLYRSFRTREVASVLEEVDFHRRHNDIEYFIFHDSMLNADFKKLEMFCDGVINRFRAILWEAQVGVRRDMAPELFAKMKKSGCCNLFVGLESGSDRTLKNMRKGFTAKDAAEFFKKLKEAGLNFGVSLIVGYPGETDKDFKESLDFIVKNKDLIPKIEQINPFVYYDGTDAPSESYRTPTEEALRRTDIFVATIKEHGIKHTNAFIGNLVERASD